MRSVRLPKWAGAFIGKLVSYLPASLRRKAMSDSLLPTHHSGRVSPNSLHLSQKFILFASCLGYSFDFVKPTARLRVMTLLCTS